MDQRSSRLTPAVDERPLAAGVDGEGEGLRGVTLAHNPFAPLDAVGGLRLNG